MAATGKLVKLAAPTRQKPKLSVYGDVLHVMASASRMIKTRPIEITFDTK
jgi:hypothetical protein